MERPSNLPAEAPTPGAGNGVAAVWRATGGRLAASSTLRELARDRVALGSLLFLVAVAVAAAAAPLVAPQDPLHTDLAHRLQAPGAADHLLGTDGQGRDILSRLIWGGRLSLIGGLLPVIVSGAIGYVLGMVAGFFNHRFIDSVIMRTLDVFYAFPAVILAIGVSAALGPGFIHVTLSLVIVIIPGVARIAHASTLSVMTNDYIQAARASGARTWRIIFSFVVPNSFAPVLVYCTTLIGLVIVYASGLSFLGLGIQPPTAEWGAMVGELKDFTFTAPAVVAVPGAMILAVSVAFNVLGDGLRDVLDPRLK